MGLSFRPAVIFLVLAASLLPDFVVEAEGKTCRERYAGLSRFMEKPKQAKWVSVLESGLNVQALVNLTTYPYRPLAQDRTVRVVGRLLSSEKKAAEVAGSIGSFDDFLTDAGFRIPKSSRVILADRPLLPGFTGPFSVSIPIFNVADWRLPENTLALHPFGFRGKGVGEESAVLHERTHGILHATYSNDAYVNKDQTIQEALADALTALYREDAKIGRGVLQEQHPVRDVSTRAFAGPREGQVDFVSGPSRLSAEDGHNNSLLFSNVLWRLQAGLGREKMHGLIKPIVDDLNLHFGSARKPIGLGPKEEDDWNLTYFLASLEKTLRNAGEAEGATAVQQFAFQYRRPDTVKDMSRGLVRTGKFDYAGSLPPRQLMLLYGITGATAAAEGGAAYYLFDKATRSNDPPPAE